MVIPIGLQTSFRRSTFSFIVTFKGKLTTRISHPSHQIHDSLPPHALSLFARSIPSNFLSSPYLSPSALSPPRIPPSILFPPGWQDIKTYVIWGEAERLRDECRVLVERMEKGGVFVKGDEVYGVSKILCRVLGRQSQYMPNILTHSFLSPIHDALISPIFTFGNRQKKKTLTCQNTITTIITPNPGDTRFLHLSVIRNGDDPNFSKPLEVDSRNLPLLVIIADEDDIRSGRRSSERLGFIADFVVK